MPKEHARPEPELDSGMSDAVNGGKQNDRILTFQKSDLSIEESNTT